MEMLGFQMWMRERVRWQSRRPVGKPRAQAAINPAELPDDPEERDLIVTSIAA